MQLHKRFAGWFSGILPCFFVIESHRPPARQASQAGCQHLARDLLRVVLLDVFLCGPFERLAGFPMFFEADLFKRRYV